MIDIHAHILPGIDDGPKTWEQAMELLLQGVEDGIGGVVCTSHVLDRLDDKTEALFLQRFQDLKSRIGKLNLPIEVWLGSEIHIQARFDPGAAVATLNGTGRYILLEFPMGQVPSHAGDVFFQLTLDHRIPILAHPERNTQILQHPELIYSFIQRGVLMQVNAGSFTGEFGKPVRQLVYDMMDRNWVHFIASDAHSRLRRPLILGEARDVVAQRWGHRRAERLLSENPRRVIAGDPLSMEDKAVSPEDRSGRKNGLSGLFKRRKM